MRDLQSTLPDLFHQESHALSVYFEVLNKLHLSPNASLLSEIGGFSRLLQFSEQLMREYLALENQHVATLEAGEPIDNQLVVEINSKEPVVCTLLGSLLEMEDTAIHKLLPTLMKYLVELTSSPSISVRKVLKRVLSRHVIPLVLMQLNAVPHNAVDVPH